MLVPLFTVRFIKKWRIKKSNCFVELQLHPCLSKKKKKREIKIKQLKNLRRRLHLALL